MKYTAFIEFEDGSGESSEWSAKMEKLFEILQTKGQYGGDVEIIIPDMGDSSKKETIYLGHDVNISDYGYYKEDDNV